METGISSMNDFISSNENDMFREMFTRMRAQRLFRRLTFLKIMKIGMSTAAGGAILVIRIPRFIMSPPVLYLERLYDAGNDVASTIADVPKATSKLFTRNLLKL
jgi:hypothetical protein